MESLFDTPFNTSAKSYVTHFTSRHYTVNNGRLLHLYSRTQVVICIQSASHEYKLPKALLCMQVPYSAAMFQEDRFMEGAELSTTLEEIDFVVSSQSFEMLMQWVCHNRIVFGD